MQTKEFLTKDQNIQNTRTISEINKEDGTATRKEEEIRDEFDNIYKNLYKEENTRTEIDMNKLKKCAGDRRAEARGRRKDHGRRSKQEQSPTAGWTNCGIL